MQACLAPSSMAAQMNIQKRSLAGEFGLAETLKGILGTRAADASCDGLTNLDVSNRGFRVPWARNRNLLRMMRSI